jgi:LmbE family N-acetylglucosaminyl deacetylase
MLGNVGGGNLSPRRRRGPAAGNFDGLGAVRSRELVAAAAELGVVEARIKV